MLLSFHIDVCIYIINENNYIVHIYEKSGIDARTQHQIDYKMSLLYISAFKGQYSNNNKVISLQIMHPVSGIFTTVYGFNIQFLF